METIQPMCDVCEHRKSPFTCKAYPLGIPIAILKAEVDHRKPHMGDKGIQFSPIKDKDLVKAILADY